MTHPAERIHPASPRRRQQARERGHVAKSRDLAQSAVLLCGLAGLAHGSGGLVQFFGRFARNQLSGVAWHTGGAEQVVDQGIRGLAGLAYAVLPLLLLLFAAAVLANLGQTGFLFLPQRLAPQWSRLSPAQGLKRIFSVDQFVVLVFGLLKAALVLAVVLWSLWDQRADWMALGAQPLPALAAGFLNLVLWTGVKAAGTLLVLAAIDYAWQRWRYERQLRMTPEELREELRQQEGDPRQVRRRRELQRILTVGRVSEPRGVAERDAA